METSLFGFFHCHALPGFLPYDALEFPVFQCEPGFRRPTPERHPVGEADSPLLASRTNQPGCKRPFFLVSFESDSTTCVPYPLNMMSGCPRIQGRPRLEPHSIRANDDRATDTTTAAALAGADQPTRSGCRKFLQTGMWLGFVDSFLVERRVSYFLRDA
ncbi:hypothetical protein CGRA01v4_13126 [Colletotrichum graminicola]|nr:hypothetical protein CGRA01v4_13126 [Colletotrichum graminicola]